MSFIDAQEFNGELTLTNKTLSFGGITISLPNISKINHDQLIRVYRFSIFHMIIAGIVICIFINHMLWGLLFVLPAAWVIYSGIMERKKPDLFKVSLNLNSGKTHELISADKKGSWNLYSKIKEAMDFDRPVNQVFHFNPGKIVSSTNNYNVHNSQVGAVGSNASANVNFNNNTTADNP